MLYELLCGITPFESRNAQRTFEKIVHSQKYISFPKKFEPHAKSILRKLLYPNPALRLGALQNGGADVREHAFFTTQNINFDKLLNMEVPMAYKPPVIPDNVVSSPDLKVEEINLLFEMNAAVSDEYTNYFGDLQKQQNMSEGQ